MNQLTRLSDFQKVLTNYTPSSEAKDLLQQTKLVLLVGPTSSGRNTIINELVASGKYRFIVSDTTRQPRINNGVLEENGGAYWFRAEADFLHDLEAGQFLEAAIIHKQQVSGISVRELALAAQEDKVAINEVEVAGADNIHAAKPDTLFLFVVAPSFNEWRTRMESRGKLPDDEVRRRLASAVDEITTALSHDYYKFVVNDNFINTAQRIDSLVHDQLPADDDSELAAREVAAKLLKDTQEFLATHD